MKRYQVCMSNIDAAHALLPRMCWKSDNEHLRIVEQSFELGLTE